MNKRSKLYMAGTEGTGKYIVLAHTCRGRVGIRVLAGNSEEQSAVGEARIRVEPAKNAKLLATMRNALSGWKQPDSDANRFSTIVQNDGLVTAMRQALSAIGAGSIKTVANSAAPAWMQALL